MIKKTMAVAVLMLTALTVGATEKRFDSPDGKMTVIVNDEGGKPTYQVVRGGVTFLERSPLGVNTNVADLTTGLTMKECEVRTVNDEYTLKTTKQSHVRYEATEAVCQFEKDGWHALDVIFRVTGRDRKSVV